MRIQKISEIENNNNIIEANISLNVFNYEEWSGHGVDCIPLFALKTSGWNTKWNSLFLRKLSRMVFENGGWFPPLGIGNYIGNYMNQKF